jgi:hypothetical protein
MIPPKTSIKDFHTPGKSSELQREFRSSKHEFYFFKSVLGVILVFLNTDPQRYRYPQNFLELS